MSAPVSASGMSTTDPITLQPSPYAYVRTIVMRSKLFEKSEYDKMVKMQLAEIIQFLEESVYKQEIDELAVAESGVQLVEHAVNRNFRRTVEKLRRISDPDLRLVIDAYLWRNDVQNIKTLLRAKLASEKKERFANLIVPGTIPKETLLTLFSMSSVEDALNSLSVPFTRGLTKIYLADGLSAAETSLTKQYYAETLAVAQRIIGEGQHFRDFLLLEISVTNVLTILKLKHEGANTEHIKAHLVHDERVSQSADFAEQVRSRLEHKLLAAKTVADCFHLLRKTKMGAELEQAQEEYEKSRSLLQAERHLQQYLLRRAKLISHQHPLSVDVILGFLFAKVQENRNLFMLIKGKQLGVSEQFLEQELVIA